MIVELMKNSRRSDRELAKVVGTSQPKVSRIIKRLEREGIIKEYTIIPDFKRLGYEIMGITFVKKRVIDRKENAELRKTVEKIEETHPYASLLALEGTGLGRTTVFITLYRDYGRFSQAMQLANSLPYVDIEGLETFLVDLNDIYNYRMLTMQQVARNIQEFQPHGKRPLHKYSASRTIQK